MPQTIGIITIVVADYDEAITFYCTKLGFELREDTPQGNGKRWVRVAPPGSRGADLLLARAVTPQQQAAVGNQTGGRVGFFLYTDNFERDYQAMREHGVTFLEEPRNEAYGTVVVFTDLYGNKWDLLEVRMESA